MRRLSPAGAAVGAGALAMAASGPGQSFGLAVFTDDFIAGTDTSRATFSVVYAVATVGSALLATALGRIIDRVGPVVVWCGAVGGLATALLALSVSASLLALAPALCAARALGQGSLPLLATVVISGSEVRARGRAMGIAVQGLTVSGALLPPLATALVVELGYADALRVLAAVLVAIVLPLGAVLLRTAHPQRARDDRRRAAVPGSRTGVWLLATALAVPPLVTTGLVVHAVAIGEDAGVGRGVAAAAVSAVAIGHAVGALVSGVLVDRHGPRVHLTALATTIGAAPLLVLVGAGGLGLVVGYATSGLAGSLVLVANATLWPAAYGEQGIAAVQGKATGVQIAGAALGPLPVAASYALTDTATAGLIGMAAAALVTAALARLWLARVPGLRAGGAADPPT